jgi:hypothetical protein
MAFLVLELPGVEKWGEVRTTQKRKRGMHLKV